MFVHSIISDEYKYNSLFLLYYFLVSGHYLYTTQTLISINTLFLITGHDSSSLTNEKDHHYFLNSADVCW